MPRGKRRPFVLNQISPYMLEAPLVPDGYRTIAHWWATKERKALAILENWEEALREEEAAALRQARAQYVCVVQVEACRHYELRGQATEAAFPMSFLAEFYPVMP